MTFFDIFEYCLTNTIRYLNIKSLSENLPDEFNDIFDFEQYNYPGTDNHIISNYITNSSGKGISIWGPYQNFTVKDNYIDNATDNK